MQLRSLVPLVTAVVLARAAEQQQKQQCSCNIERFRTKHVRSPGFHLACIVRVPGNTNIKAGDESTADIVEVRLYKDSLDDGNDPRTFRLRSAKGEATTEALRAGLERAVDYKKQTNDWPPTRKQPWALFSAEGGHRLETLDAALAAPHGEVFMIEGGQFMWPLVEVGHKHKVSNIPGLVGVDVFIETLSLQPRVFEVKGFLKGSECDAIRHMSKPHMGASTTVRSDGDHGKADSTWRTSETFWLQEWVEHEDASSPNYNGKLVKSLDHRVANLTRVPASHQEATQVLSYGIGGKYDAHMDPMDPAELQQMPFQVEAIHDGHYARLATVFWYLNDVEEGGETGFPRAPSGWGGEVPMKNCEFSADGPGMRVRPEKGKVIIFYNLLPNGNIDEHSLHTGCPVKRGRKWAANKWVWNKPANMLGSAFDPNSAEYLAAVDRLHAAEAAADEAGEAGGSGKMAVTFLNQLDQPVDVLYVPEDGSKMLDMIEALAPGDTSSLSSFHGHTFAVRRAQRRDPDQEQKAAEADEVGRYTLNYSRDGRKLQISITAAGLRT